MPFRTCRKAILRRGKTKTSKGQKIPLAKVLITEDQMKAALRVLESGSYILGEENEKLEEEFARYCGTKYAVAVNSGTAALHLSLLASGIKAGHEVITVSHTFIATANAILFCDGKPVFVDIDPKTYTMDPKELEGKITKRTKAIIPVHLYGHPAEMDQISEVAQKHGLYVIEDACQAHGAEYKGHRVGSLGDISCFSFYPSKNITACGDGGIILTDDKKLAQTARILRNQGQRERNLHVRIGFTMRLNEVQAAIVRIQLKHLDEWNESRRRNANSYNDLLEENKKIIRPVEKVWGRHVYHYYVVRTPERDKLMEYLKAAGIGVGIHYPIPIHLQPPYKAEFGFAPGTLQVTERVAQEILSLPCHPALSPSDIEFITDQVNEFTSTS